MNSEKINEFVSAVNEGNMVRICSFCTDSQLAESVQNLFANLNEENAKKGVRDSR